MPIVQHSIRDEASFSGVTEGRAAAGLYFYEQLDCLVDIAHAVADDFFARPHLYTDLGDASVAKELARLSARYGTDEQIPAPPQRQRVYAGVFGGPVGAPEAVGDFERLCRELLDATEAFAERVYDTSVEMLRQRVRAAHRPFKDYLLGVQGESLNWSTTVALRSVIHGLACPVLRNPGVCSVFGISGPPRAQWPFGEDAQGDKLVEQISGQLAAASGGADRLTREKFSTRHRVALRGAEALATVLDFAEEEHDDADLDVLIGKCYTWTATRHALAGPAPATPFTQ